MFVKACWAEIERPIMFPLFPSPFPWSSVTGIRSFVTGSTNTTMMKRVELIVGEKAEPVTRWAEGTRADALAAEVRQALGLPDQSAEPS